VIVVVGRLPTSERSTCLDDGSSPRDDPRFQRVFPRCVRALARFVCSRSRSRGRLFVLSARRYARLCPRDSIAGYDFSAKTLRRLTCLGRPARRPLPVPVIVVVAVVVVCNDRDDRDRGSPTIDSSRCVSTMRR